MNSFPSLIAAAARKGEPVWTLFKITFWEWWNDNTFRLAASLAFYTTFSMAPILLIAVNIASLVFSTEQATAQIVHQIEDLIGAEGGKAVGQVLKNFGESGGSPLAAVLGVITLVIGSTVVFAELQSALNMIWDVQVNPKRSAIKGLLATRMRSFAIVLGVGFLLLVSLIISAALTGAQEYMADRIQSVPWLWRILEAVASFGVIALLFGMIYKYLPDVKITWRDVAIGAMVSAALFNVGKFLIGIYLGQMAVGSAYGAAGSFVVLLIWVYYSALISFFGAEFTQVYARRYGSRIRPQEHAVRIGRKTETLPEEP